jgi:PAS domain S-box-containing protein
MPNSNILNKNQLIDILDSVNVGLIFVDKDNRIAFVNKAAETIRKIDSDKRIGTSVLDCHSNKVHSKVVVDMDSFKHGAYSSRHKMIRSNGEYFDNTYSVVNTENGEFEGVVLLSQNVTEKVGLEKELKNANLHLERKVKKRTEEIENAYKELKVAQEQLMQSEKMAAIGQFVSGMAHEINNPLDGIQNCIRAVIAEPEDKAQTNVFLPLALEGLSKIEILVKQLLNYAKPKSEKMRVWNIIDVLYESLSITRFRFKEKKIELIAEFKEDNYKVFCESQSLGQVFVNIILNSIDAMEEWGKLTISAKEEDGSIIISFKDTGCGISKENIKQIFNPFFTTKQKHNGTGLGLYLSYNFVKYHNGDIFVESKQNVGTEFKIRLPISKLHEVNSEKEVVEEYI